MDGKVKSCGLIKYTFLDYVKLNFKLLKNQHSKSGGLVDLLSHGLHHLYRVQELV